jgi:hypothetical protein
LPLHTRRRVIEAVLNEILGLHNKPKAAVHPEHKVTGPKKKKKKKKERVCVCEREMNALTVGMETVTLIGTL